MNTYWRHVALASPPYNVDDATPTRLICIGTKHTT